MRSAYPKWGTRISTSAKPASSPPSFPDRIITVSYTHLDVYKRQGQGIHICFAVAVLHGQYAVTFYYKGTGSYTHRVLVYEWVTHRVGSRGQFNQVFLRLFFFFLKQSQPTTEQSCFKSRVESIFPLTIEFFSTYNFAPI